MDPDQGGSKHALKPWNTISATLGAGVMAMTVVAGAVVWFTVAKMAEREFNDEHARQARTISTLIARDLSERMLAGGGPEVWANVSSEARHFVEMSGATRVMAFTAAGVVKAASDAAAVGTRIEVRGNPECPGCDWTTAFPATVNLVLPDGLQRLRVVNPIPTSQSCVACHTKLEQARGFISVDFNLSGLRTAAAERQRVILGLGVGTSLVLVILLIFMVRRVVTGPVTSLEGSMDRLAEGTLTERVTVPVKNEIATLAGHFNRMALRLQAARTETTLLYRLVVEASKKLEMSDFARNVCQVIQENLRPRQSTFILEAPSGGWIRARSSDAGEATLATGEEPLDAAFVPGSTILDLPASTMAAQLASEAQRSLRLQKGARQDGVTFALPVVSDGRLIGMLLCQGVPNEVPLGAELIENLGVHLMLAANNSRHYTGATTDGLTRLANKQYGLLRLEEALFAAKRYQSGLILVMCDIDHFKRINDTHGHVAGDAVLREVARRIRESVRKADTVVRYGGEEFMLIITQVGSESLAMLGEKIRLAVSAAPISLAGEAPDTVQITVSVGIASENAKTESGQELIERADAALYRAKRAGRNRVEVDY